LGEVPLREHIEKLLADHRRQHSDEREANERALDEWRQSLEHRLQQLNELRADVMRDRAMFITKPEFDGLVAAIERDREQVREQIRELRSTIDQWKGRQAAFAVALTVGLVVLSVGASAVMFLIGG
jgi:chromosome segregation ATPase